MINTKFYQNDFSKFKDYLSEKEHRIVLKKAGETINAFGEGFTHHFYILFGEVMGYGLHESGHQRNVMIPLSADSFFPLYYPVQIESAQSTSFKARTDTELMVFTHECIDACLNSCATFNREMYMALGHLMDYQLGELMHQLYLSGLSKLCRCLDLAAGNSDRPETEVIMTQMEIADYVGMNRSNTTRYLKMLRERGIIQTKRNRIIIKDRQKLRELMIKKAP